MNKLVLVCLLIGIILVSSGVTAIVLQPEVSQSENQLKTFTSKQELEDFIAKGLERAETEGLPLFGFGKDFLVAREALPPPTPAAPEYSATNIQVAGVDEADIIKTDGKFIYLASEEKFLIVEANPAENMSVVSASPVEGRLLGLFINEDKMVVFEESGFIFPKPLPESSRIIPPPSITGFHIKVYDVSDRKNPSLVRDVFLNGTYVNSRMIGDWVYTVANQPAVWWIEDKREVVLPTIYVDEETRVVPATQIHYTNSSDVPVVYTLIVALNVQVKGEAPEFKVILTGYATAMYVSQRNIYVTMPRGSWWESEGTTVIHRIAVDGRNITAKASGEIPGRILNQFSMDEHEDYFRIATTVGQSPSTNNVYILDESLKIVGRLEDLAPGEQIHSARFMGDRCYLVTFKKIDPLFTIDVSKPTEPKVLGKLKIPGYSDYLHPYGENHLIGIGKETVEAKEGDFAWYQGLKISLFDISDIEKPKEVSKLIIGDRGTESPVLRDHHALLFDQRNGLLVIPVLEAKIFPEKYPEGVPPSTQGEYVFQGVCVLHITSQDGVSVKGRITHIDDPQVFLKSGEYLQSAYEIERSLYIGEVLYTISDGKIKANSLADLAEISAVKLS